MIWPFDIIYYWRFWRISWKVVTWARYSGKRWSAVQLFPSALISVLSADQRILTADGQRWPLAPLAILSAVADFVSADSCHQRWWQLSALTKSATVDKIANGQRWSALTINGQKSLISAESADVKSCTADQRWRSALTAATRSSDHLPISLCVLMLLMWFCCKRIFWKSIK